MVATGGLQITSEKLLQLHDQPFQFPPAGALMDGIAQAAEQPLAAGQGFRQPPNLPCRHSLACGGSGKLADALLRKGDGRYPISSAFISAVRISP